MSHASIQKYRPFYVTIVLLLISIFGLTIERTYASTVLQPTPSTGLIAHWSFDAMTLNWGSNIVSDISNNNNTGTMVSMDQSTNQVGGRRGQALLFDGNIESVSLASNPLGSVNNPSSVCSWVKTNDITVAPAAWDQTFLNLYSDANNGIRMGSVTSSGYFYVTYRVGGSNYGGQTTSVAFANNSWAHVCYVWNGTAVGIQLYLNGSAVASTTNIHSLGAINTIGARNDEGDGTWYGSIDDLRIYNRELTHSEIRQIYASGALVVRAITQNAASTIASTPASS